MAQARAYVAAHPGDARPAKTHSFHTTIKRLADICLSLPLLILTAPVMLMAALMIRCSGGPAFFGHQRVGRNGAVFTCWKLRTMCTDAEARLAIYLEATPEARDEWESGRKLTHDPRITRLGRFLRRTSVDELPQLWNVLRGDMSLVGPRPVIAEELNLYGVFRTHYMALRPGITGEWQVSGRNTTSYADRIALDVSYAMQHNLLHDLMILLRTVVVVLRMTGR